MNESRTTVYESRTVSMPVYESRTVSMTVTLANLRVDHLYGRVPHCVYEPRTVSMRSMSYELCL